MNNTQSIRISHPFAKIFITLFIAFIALFAYFNNFSICIFYKITNIPCITCSMTRAVVSILQFDFAKATEYHFMVWSLPIIYWYFLTDGNAFGIKLLNISVGITVALGFVARYIWILFSM